MEQNIDKLVDDCFRSIIALQHKRITINGKRYILAIWFSENGIEEIRISEHMFPSPKDILYKCKTIQEMKDYFKQIQSENEKA